jgi:hypothetical protein
MLIRNSMTHTEITEVKEVAAQCDSVDVLTGQTLFDILQNRVRLSGFYSAERARQIVSENPDEFSAVPFGVDAQGHVFYTVYWVRNVPELNN